MEQEKEQISIGEYKRALENIKSMQLTIDDLNKQVKNFEMLKERVFRAEAQGEAYLEVIEKLSYLLKSRD